MVCWTVLGAVGLAGPQATGAMAADIVIGQSCALEGPTQQLGIRMRDGALSWFNHVNAAGGIRGRKIRLITYNDNYEPQACATNTRQLIEQDNVLLLFGYVGTPTAEAAVPIASEKGVAFFAPFTGAEFLRNPIIPQVFNLRASYFQETEAMVERLTAEKGIKRIAVLFQDDGYGRGGLEGVTRALAKRGLQVHKSASYPRNTDQVEPAVSALAASAPEAVILVGTYGPCAKFISLMRRGGSQALFFNISFVGSIPLAAALSNEGLGVVCTQVVPYPYNDKIPVVAEYKKLQKQFFPQSELDFIGMEGFLAAKALTRILETAAEPLTRHSFMEAAEAIQNADLGGFAFSFSKTNHQGADKVWFTQVGPGGFIAPIEKLAELYPYAR
jgi:ABC-type branched-subunit amino acid transport system substrate-binding protein